MPFCVTVASPLRQARSNRDGSSALNQLPAIGLISAAVIGAGRGFIFTLPSRASAAMARAWRQGSMLPRLAITTTVRSASGTRRNSVRKPGHSPPWPRVARPRSESACTPRRYLLAWPPASGAMAAS